MLIIDSREEKLIKGLNIYDIEFTIQQLDISDIHIIDNDTGLPVIIIERKSVLDYISSINDERNEEQMLRLENYTVDNKYKPMIMYIVEGSKKYLFSKDKKALNTSIINKTVQHGCHVIYAKTIVETAEKIIKIDASYHEKKIKMNPDIPIYANVIKVKKKENVTEDVFFIKTLCCIPGIGKKTAGKIVSVCPTLLSLDTDKLTGIVSTSVIEKITKYIFYEKPGFSAKK